MYINNNHKNKKVITLVDNYSSVKLLLVNQKGLFSNRLTTICCPLIHEK